MTDTAEVEQPAAPTYKDDDLVYVDPEARAVVGMVEFTAAGKSKEKAMPSPEEPPQAAGDKEKRRPRKQRYYPWGTYRSMKRVYKIEGKIMKEENLQTLDEAMEKALKEPFWD